MKISKKTKVFVDALPLCTDKLSGIGRLMVETLRCLEKDADFNRCFEVVLVIPSRGYIKIAQLGLGKIKYKQIFIPRKLWSAMILCRIMPPVDIFIGRGVYLFMNTVTWPLIFSKCITYIHDLNFINNPDTMRPKTLRALNNNLNIWIKRASKIVAISKFTKQEITKHYKINDNRIEVVYCGVNEDIFYPRGFNQVEETKEKYGLSGDYIIFVSNIEPRKNIEKLLEAYSKLKGAETNKFALLMVGGDGWNNDRILSSIEKMVNKGYRIIRPRTRVGDEDLAALLTGAHALVMPSLYEGFGIPPLEAMACGTPIVISNTTSLPEVGGRFAYYVNPNDVDDIANNISLALNADKKKISSSLIQHSREFSWQKSAKQLSHIIDNLIK